MNCKQGDRALVLNGTHSHGFDGNPIICPNTLVGAVTTCLSLVPRDGSPLWNIDPLQCSTCHHTLTVAWDRVLQPLPDPDDVRAFDENVEQWSLTDEQMEEAKCLNI